MAYHDPGDFVACYLTNTKVYEELLLWGMVIEVSPNLEDVLVLDRDGNLHWWPARRWKKLTDEKDKTKIIIGRLA